MRCNVAPAATGPASTAAQQAPGARCRFLAIALAGIALAGIALAGIALAGIALSLLVACPGVAAPGPGPCSGSMQFKEIREHLSDAPQIAGTPATGVLPADGDAFIAFRQTLDDGNHPRTFRVFETNGLDTNTFKGSSVSVISVKPMPEKLVASYAAEDSVLLDVQIEPRPFPLWHVRDFVILACSEGRLAGWGMLRARVSDPFAVDTVCVFIALLTYSLAMTAVLVARRTPHALIIKYPALFAARKLRWWDFFNPIHFVADAFHKGSVQKLQVILFSFLVGFLVLALVLQSGALVDLSPTVIGLLGISGIGAAAAQITYVQRTRLGFENWAWLERKGVLEKPDPAAIPGPRWRDLVLTNGEFDIYKLQTIIFTIAVAAALVFAGGSNLSTFSVPGTLLGILGLSQVVYIGGILVTPPAVDDLDKAVTKLRSAGETVSAAKTQNTDTDAKGNLLDKLPPGGTPGANAQRQYDDLADNVVTMLETTLGVNADRTKL